MKSVQTKYNLNRYSLYARKAILFSSWEQSWDLGHRSSFTMKLPGFTGLMVTGPSYLEGIKVPKQISASWGLLKSKVFVDSSLELDSGQQLDSTSAKQGHRNTKTRQLFSPKAWMSIGGFVRNSEVRVTNSS